jgi:hypothetical protein
MKRYAIAAAVLFSALVAAALIVPHFVSIDDKICDRERFRIDTIHAAVASYRARHGKLPEANTQLHEILKGPSGVVEKDSWGYPYRVLYLEDGEFLATSAGFEKNCRREE